jgi:hypothetical protein
MDVATCEAPLSIPKMDGVASIGPGDGQATEESQLLIIQQGRINFHKEAVILVNVVLAFKYVTGVVLRDQG